MGGAGRKGGQLLDVGFGDAGDDRMALFDTINAAPSPLPGFHGLGCNCGGWRRVGGTDESPSLIGLGCMCGASSGMGDLIATEGDCVQGEAAMAQLLAQYAALGSPPKYAAAVAALKTSFDAAEGSWKRHLPFWPGCGEIKGIGVQADQLAKQMAADTGTAAPAPITDQKPKGTIDSLVTGALWVAGLAAGAFALREAAKLKGR